MKRIIVAVVTPLVYSFLSYGADLHVPDKLIGSDTVAIVNLNLDAVTRDQLAKTLTALAGQAPDENALKQFDDISGKFKEAGAVSLSMVMSVSKGSDIAKAADNSVLVVEKKEGGDNVKIADLVYQLMPEIKAEKAPDCPKEIDGTLVWHKNDFKMPEANADRAQTFANAHAQVAEHQSLSIVFVPDEGAVEAAKGQLKPEDAELVHALLDGDGICLFSDVGIAAEPSVKLLILSADAAGADKLNKAAQGLLDQIKKEVPPPFAVLLDALKLVQAGTNVQLSIAFPELTKAAQSLMAAMAPAPGGK